MTDGILWLDKLNVGARLLLRPMMALVIIVFFLAMAVAQVAPQGVTTGADDWVMGPRGGLGYSHQYPGARIVVRGYDMAGLPGPIVAGAHGARHFYAQVVRRGGSYYFLCAVVAIDDGERADPDSLVAAASKVSPRELSDRQRAVHALRLRFAGDASGLPGMRAGSVAG